jgi:hypothetical protein
MVDEELEEFEEDVWYSDDPGEEKKASLQTKIRAFVPVVVVVIAAVYFLPSTVGGKINLSSGMNTEYGQAVNMAVACAGSSSVTVTPKSILKNEANGTGTHYLESIQVSNIPSECNGVDFVLNVFDDSSSTPLALFNGTSTDAVVWNKAGTFRVGSGGTGMSVSSSSGKFTVTFTNPAALSSSAFKVTLQSVVHKVFPCAIGGDCSIGDTGPGGGKIFYASEAGFACGVSRTATCNYLEVAPNGWFSGGADPTRTWSRIEDSRTATSFQGTAAQQQIGYGASNTNSIILQGSSDSRTAAAPLATSYAPVVNGVTINDWFLGSYSEMDALWDARSQVSTNMTFEYWTSSSQSSLNATWQAYGSHHQAGYTAGVVKYTLYKVRPIRAF